MKQLFRWSTWLAAVGLVALALPAAAQPKKPNILIIWGDDIGYWNVSAYNQGSMGYKTPNIDRIAKESAVHRLVRPAELHRRPRSLPAEAESRQLQLGSGTRISDQRSGRQVAQC
jgi:hypothetical protein